MAATVGGFERQEGSGDSKQNCSVCKTTPILQCTLLFLNLGSRSDVTIEKKDRTKFKISILNND